MNCVCGHPERDHVQGGRCRVVDCPCERYRPGDTLSQRPGRWLAWLLGLALLLTGVATAAGQTPPPSLVRVAAAARAATIVVRTAGTDAGPSVPADDLAPDLGPLDEDSPLLEPLAELEERTLASGVIVDPRGFALTSAHAVLLAPQFEVVLADGTPVRAALLAVDRRTDVALLKLDHGGAALPYLPFGDSERVEAGDWVVAVGAPMGLEGTVTAGVVTATPGSSLSPLAGFLQTDASLGLGSAGGPVVNLAGELVGLNTLLSGDSVGFARPASAVRHVYVQLLEKGRVSRSWLGVSTQRLTPELARALGAPHERGVLLADVDPEGPGAAAGLRPGDVVVALDATPVDTRAQLERATDARAPGRVVILKVRRAAGELRVRVRLGEEPDDWQVPPVLARARRLLGIEARPITPTMGVEAASVDPASPAGRAGLVGGDVIREIDRRAIRTMADFQAAIRALDPRRPVLVQIQRGGLAAYVALAPADGRD